jgi:hypothetical protein
LLHQKTKIMSTERNSRFSDNLTRIEVEYSLDDLLQLVNTNVNSDEVVIGLCMLPDNNTNTIGLHVDKILFNSSTSTTLRIQRVQVNRLSTAQRVPTVDRFAYNASIESDMAILLAHVDFSRISQTTDEVLPIIPELELSFINADVLRYYSRLQMPLYPGETQRKLYITRAVSNFFVGRDQMGAYRTLKFSPLPRFLSASMDQEHIPSAYYIGASCPPGWKEQYIATLMLSKPSANSKKQSVDITMGDILSAYEKSGIKFVPSKPSFLKVGDWKNLTQEKIASIRAAFQVSK